MAEDLENVVGNTYLYIQGPVHKRVVETGSSEGQQDTNQKLSPAVMLNGALMPREN